MKILIADDDATSLLIAQRVLRRLGYECHTASDGAQAWTTFRFLRPDVVISDWMMPGLTGLQLCTNVRGHEGGSYTYFIMLTARGAHHEILEGMSAGADDYLVKPLDLEDLQTRLVAAARVTALHRQLADQRTELDALNSQLAVIARRDPLTGLWNRRALDEDLALLEARATRYGHRYCMAMLDIDHFKSYNDSYGHLAGDQVLRAVAAKLTSLTRGGDAVYRYGGEEFLCIFPEQSVANGTLAVERMRCGVAGLALPHGAQPEGVVTVSAGLAVLGSPYPMTASEVLGAADEALYRAKQLGRNRVELPTVGLGR
ncbi:MAG: hypothetical protein QOH68_2851 [Nocardioidaceae bacterium]|nr:hypothetical protein [Nocardioidaceae bacterium]